MCVCVLCAYVSQCVLYVCIWCVFVCMCVFIHVFVCVYVYCGIYMYVSVFVCDVCMWVSCECVCVWAYQFLSKCYLHLIFLVICMYVYLCVVHAHEYSLPQRSEVLLNLELLKVVNHSNQETNFGYLEKQETLLSHFFSTPSFVP